MRQKFDVTGMSCAACSAHVEKSVKALNGVQSVQVNLLQNNMVVEYDDSLLTAEDIVAAVASGGYGASPQRKDGEKAAAEAPKNVAAEEMAEMKKRLIASFCFLVPLFYISMGHMLGAPLPSILLGEENVMIFALVQLLLTIPVLVINRKFFVVGFRALWQKAPNMDSLIALGSGASVVYSLWSIFEMAYYLGRNNLTAAHDCVMNLYLESAAMILTLITVGKYMETRSKGKTSEAISRLMDLTPKTAVVIRDDKEVEVPIEQVQVGDILVVKQGQSIPVDGILLEGNGTVDESAITGESIPVDKQVGDTLIGATVNRSGFFRMQATKVGGDTTLSQIIALVEEAASSKAPIAKLADRVSGVFVPVVITIAVVAAVVWLLVGAEFSFALSIGIAVLVISCPCALGLATPTAIMVGTGKGAEYGILMKSAESLEMAHHVQVMVLDKTGTLTEGKPQVMDILPVAGGTEEELLQLAASLEALSEHPLADAIVQQAKAKSLSLFSAEDFQADPGEGISGKVNGRQILGGNLRMMDHYGIATQNFDAAAEKLAEEGKTPLYFAQEGKLLGLIALADVLKEGSPAAVEAFHKMGIDVVMLTGDNKRTAQAIASKLGIRAIAEVLPQEKEQHVRALQAEGKRVAMVGDGINDAPALVRADVGIAIGAGTDVAIESADIVLMKSDLRDAVTAIELSRATIRNIKENLFWAFFYNACGIPLAAGVFYSALQWKLNPMFAAAAMSFSSAFVVGNALRLRFFRPSFGKQSCETGNCPVTIQPVEIEREKEEFQMKKVMKIDGMMCTHCTGRVSQVLNAMDGVEAEVSLEDKCAYVTLNAPVSDDALTQTVTDAGYTVVSIEEA